MSSLSLAEIFQGPAPPTFPVIRDPAPMRQTSAAVQPPSANFRVSRRRRFARAVSCYFPQNVRTASCSARTLENFKVVAAALSPPNCRASSATLLP